MSESVESVERCLRCGKENPGLRVDCVSGSAQYNTQVTVNGTAAYRLDGAIRDQYVTGCACPGCARKAVKAKARGSSVGWAIGGFALGFLVPYGLLLALKIDIGPYNAENPPLALFLAIAAVAGILCGLLRYRKLAALPDAFGVAFLLDRQDKNHFRHLPAEKSVYPGADEAAKKRYFLRLDLFPGDKGSTLANRIWDKHMK